LRVRVPWDLAVFRGNTYMTLQLAAALHLAALGRS
jgi:hypothetical protein